MNKLMNKLTTFSILIALVTFSATLALAGDLEPPSGPAPSMKTLQQIWDKLESIENTCCSGGGDASIPKTGQTTSYGDRDDGALQQGVAWPDPRFTDNGDGTVTDNLTNLVWLKDANCFGTQTWTIALAAANGLADDACGLSDGSVAGDWWLPNRRELFSLVDDSQDSPALPSDHLFINVQSATYWSSTALAGISTHAWAIYLVLGDMNYIPKTENQKNYVWPVRAGQ